MDQTPEQSTANAALPSVDVVYSALAARRSQFDSLLWQAPALGLTAQAFLMVIVLDQNANHWSKSVSCILSIILTLMTIQLMTRTRQAEITDAHWLKDLEKELPEAYRIHGPAWRERRNLQSPDAGWLSFFAGFPGYYTWVIGIALFGFASLSTLALEWIF